MSYFDLLQNNVTGSAGISEAERSTYRLVRFRENRRLNRLPSLTASIRVEHVSDARRFLVTEVKIEPVTKRGFSSGGNHQIAEIFPQGLFFRAFEIVLPKRIRGE